MRKRGTLRKGPGGCNCYWQLAIGHWHQPRPGLRFARLHSGRTNMPEPKPGSSWPKDEFGKDELRQQFWVIWPGPAVVLVVLLAWPALQWLRGSSASVTVYAAQDQVFAEPLLKEFERETGIRVRAAYDSEAVKTVGLANRLL